MSFALWAERALRFPKREPVILQPWAPPAPKSLSNTSAAPAPAPEVIPQAPKELTMSEVSDALKNGFAELKAEIIKLEPEAQALISVALAKLEPAVTAAVPVLDTEAAAAASSIPTVGPALAAAITAAEPTFLTSAKSVLAYLGPLVSSLETKAEAALANA